jgi:hypothetical protein
MDSIEDRQAEIQRGMDENLAPNGSEEDFAALLADQGPDR